VSVKIHKRKEPSVSFYCAVSLCGIAPSGVVYLDRLELRSVFGRYHVTDSDGQNLQKKLGENERIGKIEWSGPDVWKYLRTIDACESVDACESFKLWMCISVCTSTVPQRAPARHVLIWRVR
jgi:hypothetical protein